MTDKQYEKIISYILDSIEFAACVKTNDKILASNKLFKDNILNMSDKEIQQKNFFVESINLIDDIKIFVYKPDYVKKLNFTKNALREAVKLL